jgi:sulfite reductase beta subunit-like hemoprotein
MRNEIGFQLLAGGGLSTLRRSALTVEEFVPAGELLEAADAIVRVFHRIGNRHNRAKARLKWAIDKICPEAFLAEYRAERDKIRAEGGVPLVLPPQPAVPQRRAPPPRSRAPGYDAWAARVGRREAPGSRGRDPPDPRRHHRRAARSPRWSSVRRGQAAHHQRAEPVLR